MRQTKKALQYNDQNAASITLSIEEEIDLLIGEYKLNHIKRLEDGVCISDSGLIFTDILTDLEPPVIHLIHALPLSRFAPARKASLCKLPRQASVLP